MDGEDKKKKDEDETVDLDDRIITAGVDPNKFDIKKKHNGKEEK